MSHFVHRRHTIGAFLALAICWVPPSASAQWTEEPGTGWIQLNVSYQQTRNGFDRDGEVVPLVQTPGDDGESTIATVRFTGALGLVRGIDSWIDVPFHHQRFTTANPVTDDLTNTGFGDPRIYLRVEPILFGIDTFPVALRSGVKFTSNNFSVSSETISLSEGQRDWELLLELGASLHPWPVYLQGWVGYRWRERNEKIGRDPGDERVCYIAVGGSWNRFRWKLAVDGQYGHPSSRRVAGGRLEFPPRELVQVVPRVGWALGPGNFQILARIPVHGRSTSANKLPAAPTFLAGYFLSWNHALW